MIKSMCDNMVCCAKQNIELSPSTFYHSDLGWSRELLAARISKIDSWQLDDSCNQYAQDCKVEMFNHLNPSYIGVGW